MLRKFSRKCCVTSKPKIWNICVCTNCHFTIPHSKEAISTKRNLSTKWNAVHSTFWQYSTSWKCSLHFFYVFRTDWNFSMKFCSSDPSFNRNILRLLYLKFKPSVYAHIAITYYFVLFTNFLS